MTDRAEKRDFVETQLAQERGYSLPYHYFYRKRSLNEIIYASYLLIVTDLLLTLTSGKKHWNLLDAGCGDGRFIYGLSESPIPGLAEMHGVDYSEAALGFARLYNPDATFRNRELRSTGYPDGFFEFIDCIETLEHIAPDQLKFVVGELARILNPSGRMIVTVPSKRLPQQKSHYQHFDLKGISRALFPHFNVISNSGNDRRTLPLRLFYLLMENRVYQVKHQRLLNLLERVYDRYGRSCSPGEGNRLILVCK